jgi:multimeric flavodoxin WrbA
MKIQVLNGSPKGDKESITMQYIHYSKQLFPKYDFNVINIGSILNNFSIRDETFQDIVKEMQSADGLIWSFPIYTTLIPAQLKKFIELLFEQDCNSLKDKYTICLSTSMKFYDINAHNYMRAICEDLGLKFVGFYSAHTYDFLEFEYRKKWYTFLNNFFSVIKEKKVVPRRFFSIKENNFNYIPKPSMDLQKINADEVKVLILTDCDDENSNIANMIQRFKDCFSNKVHIYNFNEFNIKGGCLGCLKCGLDNQCVYNDEFFQLFQKVKNCDIIVFAGTIKDRFLSSQWKLYFDRGFHNGHTPSMEGKQVCFLISGPLSKNENIREWIKAMTELGYANLVDVVVDEVGDSELIDRLIYTMAENAISLFRKDYISPSTFYQIGGYKIFRDMIFGLPGAIFQMDFKFFKERDMFDFPTRDLKDRILRRILSILLKFKKIRKRFKSQLPSKIIAPFHNKMEKIKFDIERTRLKEE